MQVIDELVVLLRLDTSEYDKQAKKVDGMVDASEKKLRAVDEKREKRDTAQIARNKELIAGAKALSTGLKSLALTVGSVLGVGSAAGLVGTVIALTGVELGLRRAAVASGMSNKEMNAWSATAKRMGADAQAGAAAIADLAREQKTFHQTGSAPTMQALARIGVHVSDSSKPEEMLAQAQKVYRNASPAQQSQIESTLAVSGVSNDLILMIKSEKDAREEYAASYKESADENRKAMDAVSTALATLENVARNIATVIATVVQPYVEKFASWLSDGAQKLAQFAKEVQDAGGGLDGLEKVLRQRAPEVSEKLGMVATGLRTMSEAVDVAANGVKLFGEAVKSIGEQLLDKLAPKGTALRENIDRGIGFLSKNSGGVGADQAAMGGAIIGWVRKNWPGAVADAERNGPAPVGHVMGWTGGAKLAASSPAPSGGRTAAVGSGTKMEQVIDSILRQNPGIGIDKAIAMAENWRSENDTFDPARSNGSHVGIAQWDKKRQASFKRTYGHELRDGTLDEQIHFATHDPYEKSLMEKSFAGRTGVGGYAAGYSQTFEAHGLLGETANRAQRAERYAAQRGVTGGASAADPGGATINIQTVNVQANSPQEMVGGITRASGVQNYQSAVR